MVRALARHAKGRPFDPVIAHMTVGIYIAAGIVVVCLICSMIIAALKIKEEDERQYGNKNKSRFKIRDGNR